MGDQSVCSNGIAWDLNYPSFILSSTSAGQSVSWTFNRTVTNVGTGNSTYKAIVNAAAGLKIEVEPSVLSFKSVGEKQSFVLTVSATFGNSTTSGSLVWSDGKHTARSPVVAFVSSTE